MPTFWNTVPRTTPPGKVYTVQPKPLLSPAPDAREVKAPHLSPPQPNRGKGKLSLGPSVTEQKQELSKSESLDKDKPRVSFSELNHSTAFHEDVTKRRLRELQEWNDRLEKNPNDVKALDQRGLLYTMLGYSEEALQDFERALAIEPDNMYFCFQKTILLKHFGRYPEALEHCKILMNRKPGESEVEKLHNEINAKIHEMNSPSATSPSGCSCVVM